MNVVVLHDWVAPAARPDEADVLVQADLVSRALAALHHSHQCLAFPLDLDRIVRELRRAQPDAVVNLVESVEGSSRLSWLATALLEQLRLPFTGSGTEPMLTTSNKALAKCVLHSAGVATPPWLRPPTAPPMALPLPGRFMIKPVCEDASVGITDEAVVDLADEEALADAVRERSALCGCETFAEAFVDGREFNLSILASEDGPVVLPPAEIEFVGFAPGKPRIVGYAAKWDADSPEFNGTPRRFDFPAADAPLLDALVRMARACWDIFGLCGYARVDFRVDAAGRPYVLEVNANPCLSPDAGFMAAVRRAGLTPEDVVQRILDDARRSAAAPSLADASSRSGEA